ncbi:response regulator [Fundicoccus culcitae]|uniref:Response regulator n=1 Tax=Fundicoccus culcitae TaxID=2969821 RepID=A0ABY5P969_9LACT|nr:response regulator [Fundicoccus culcitae]UUX35140.1 response regulator [Fundicoccus culcitae]
MSDKILLVDDHIDELNMLSFIISKHFPQYQLVTALNGKQGIQLYNTMSFDFIITDVQMPIMNGIEMIKIIRIKEPNIPVLFISGFDEFKYVKEAITLQVIEYLLKPIEPKVLVKQIKTIIQNKRINEGHLKEIQELELNTSKHLIVELINGKLYSEFSLEEQQLIIKYTSTSFYIILIEVNVFNSSGYSLIKQFLAKMNKYDYILISPRESLFIIPANKKADLNAIKQEFIEKLDNNLINLVNLYVSRNISHPKNTFEEFSNLKNNTLKNFYEVNSTDNSIAKKDEDFFLYQQTHLENIKQFIHAQNIESLETYLNQLIDDLILETPYSPNYIRFFFSNIFEKIITNFDLNIANYDKIFSQLINSQHISEIKKYIDQIFRDLYEREKILDYSGDLYVNETKKYILNHYNQNFSLEDISDYIGLSPKYISDIFSRNEGVGISKFTNKIRIDKATELLQNTNHNIGQIGLLVGYSNDAYFIRKFKEIIGMTPNAYRIKYYRNEL